MDRRFFAILAAITLIFIGIFIFTGSDKTSDTGNSGSKAKPTSHVYGEGKKAVTLTEYGDFQCSACFAYYPVVSQVVETYKNDIFFQFRHLPLIQIHPNAFAASRAAEAASYQGKFFEMYNQLYSPDNWQSWTQSQRPKTLFDTYAKDIGLNMEKFNADYGSTKVNDAINADIAAFDKTKATKSTPTFFINGEFVDNSRFLGSDGRPDPNAMAKVIQEAIDKKKSQ
jgi:protein-disulfide isomerase